MTKTKKTSKNISYLDLIKALFNYKTFNKDFKIQPLVIYTIILTILITIVSVLKNNIENYSILPNITVIFYSSIGLAIIAFSLYTAFYIFINAYLQKSKEYFRGFFISTCVFLPFMLMGHFIDYLSQVLFNPIMALISTILIFIITIYAIIAYIFTMRNYYQTSFPKVIASMLQSFILFSMVLLSMYISQLISMIK